MLHSGRPTPARPARLWRGEPERLPGVGTRPASEASRARPRIGWGRGGTKQLSLTGGAGVAVFAFSSNPIRTIFCSKITKFHLRAPTASYTSLGALRT